MQGFPAAAQDPRDCDTTWEIRWDFTNGNNPGSLFRIRSAIFKWQDKFGKPQEVVVAKNLQLAEVYAPYNDGQNAFLDRQYWVPQPARKDFLGPNCVAPGQILADKVYREVHDDGIRWLWGPRGNDKFPHRPDRGRRGEKLILWSTFNADNYRYLTEYHFTDDGRIVCRLGFSARNYFPRKTHRGDVQLNIGCWRMEFDLGDAAQNEIFLSRRVLDAKTRRFTQQREIFAREGKGLWEADKFTTLQVVSGARKNSHNLPIAYELVPFRLGSVRSLQPQGNTLKIKANMDFINYDFWVTRRDLKEFTRTSLKYTQLPRYASQERPLAGQPAIVWYSTPALHVPRGEDFGDDGVSNVTGAALTAWAEFTLRPRDLFDGTPLFKYVPPGGQVNKTD